MDHCVAIIGGAGLLGRALSARLTSLRSISYSSRNTPGSVFFDISNKDTWASLLNQRHQKVILLSWRYLDDYHTSNHLTENLVECIQLVQRLIDRGLKEIVVAGTCYEYGLSAGCLSPTHAVNPVTAYGLAKDLLHKSIKALCIKDDVRLCWARIFFTYSPDQRRSSLLPTLLMAHRNGFDSVNLGPEYLIRDFISIDQVAELIVTLTTNANAQGVFNCGTGIPTSLRSFVESMIKEYSLDVRPIFNVHQRRPFEPVAAWADMSAWYSLCRLSPD